MLWNSRPHFKSFFDQLWNFYLFHDFSNPTFLTAISSLSETFLQSRQTISFTTLTMDLLEFHFLQPALKFSNRILTISPRIIIRTTHSKLFIAETKFYLVFLLLFQFIHEPILFSGWLEKKIATAFTIKLNCFSSIISFLSLLISSCSVDTLSSWKDFPWDWPIAFF